MEKTSDVDTMRDITEDIHDVMVYGWEPDFYYFHEHGGPFIVHANDEHYRVLITVEKL